MSFAVVGSRLNHVGLSCLAYARYGTTAVICRKEKNIAAAYIFLKPDAGLRIRELEIDISEKGDYMSMVVLGVKLPVMLRDAFGKISPRAATGD